MHRLRMAIKILSVLIAFAVVLSLSPTASGHYGGSGYARAEYVHEPYPAQSPNVTTTQSHIWLNSQTLTWPGDWMWAAASMTKPATGQDCHSDSFVPTQVRVMRVGWMKKRDVNWNNGNSSYAIAAFINDDNVIGIAKYAAVTGVFPYKIRKPALPSSSNQWSYQIYDSGTSSWIPFFTIGTYYDFNGIAGNLKCVTYGSWASTTLLNMGVTQLRYPVYRSTVTGDAYNFVPLDTSNHHAAVNDIYYTIAIGEADKILQVHDR